MPPRPPLLDARQVPLYSLSRRVGWQTRPSVPALPPYPLTPVVSSWGGREVCRGQGAGGVVQSPTVGANAHAEVAGHTSSKHVSVASPAPRGARFLTYLTAALTRERGLQGPRCRGRMPALMGLPFGVGPSGVVSSKHVPVAPPDVSQL